MQPEPSRDQPTPDREATAKERVIGGIIDDLPRPLTATDEHAETAGRQVPAAFVDDLSFPINTPELGSPALKPVTGIEEPSNRPPEGVPAVDDRPADLISPITKPASSTSPPVGTSSRISTPASSAQTSSGSSGDATPSNAPTQERDIWWGSYSGLTMIPSFLVCIVLSIVVFWTVNKLVHPDLKHMVILGLNSAIWAVQITRWSYRVFGYNYRVTNRTMYVDKGWLYSQANRIPLEAVQRLNVEQTFFEKLAGVGRIEVVVNQAGEPPILLEGIRHPEQVVATLQEKTPLLSAQPGELASKA